MQIYLYHRIYVKDAWYLKVIVSKPTPGVERVLCRVSSGDCSLVG